MSQIGFELARNRRSSFRSRFGRLKGQLGFEPTTDQASPDYLPGKQEIAHERPSLRMRCNV